jgi:branched-chain amino acid transport system permease protein
MRFGDSRLSQDIAALLVLNLAVALLATLSGEYARGAFVLFAINVVLVISYRVITTMGGWSFAHVAIMGTGAYTVAILTKPPFDIPVLAAIALGGLLAGLVAFVLAWPVLRTRQYYFFLSTFAAGEALRQCFIQLREVTGGTSGIAFIERPEFLDPSSTLGYLFFVQSVMVLLALVYISLDASETGKKISAVGSDEQLAGSLGMNAWGLRSLAFVLGSVGAGLAGGLLASFNSIVSPSDFSGALMFKIVAAAIIGGTTRFTGPILGLICLTLVEEFFRGVPVYVPLIWGMAVIIVLLFAPGGLEQVLHKVFLFVTRGRRHAQA